MKPQALPLPPNFTIGGYKVTALVESTQEYYLYQALSPEGQPIQLCEFCPQGLVERDMASGELSVEDSERVRFEQALAAFDAQCSAHGAQGKILSLGTALFVYPAAQAQTPAERPTPAAMPAHARALRPGAAKPATPARVTPAAGPALKKPLPGAMTGKPVIPMRKSSGGFPTVTVIVIGMLALFGFLGYQILKEKEEPVTPTLAKPTPPPVKPKPKPVAPKEEPVIVVPDEPEPVVVTPDEPEPVVTEEPKPDLSTDPAVIAMEEKLRAEAKTSRGNFSDTLLKKYPFYAEAYVRDYIKKRGGAFSQNFEKWMKKNKLNREVFALFYPPDPNVATNAAMIIDEIGPETADKYPQLVLAFAVGRREFGMGAFDLGHQGRFGDAMGALKGFRSSGIMPPPADLYCAGKPPVNWYGQPPRAAADEEVYKKVEAYLDNKKITPKQAWINKYNTVSTIGDTGLTEGNIESYLHEYMYRHDQLRRKRDPFPTPIEFFKYLVDKYENCSKLRDIDRKRVEWTGVSLEATPWPAMMALSETRPLRESDSVWERLMGLRGKERIWLYGPYRMDDEKEPPILFSFDPDPEWARESNERKLHEGGVCGTMSLIARNSHIARGVPAGPAGQPGHGNLMTTKYSGNGCWLEVGQSVDTLKVTTGTWYLQDSKAPRTGNAEFQAGLALSMNIDYEKFIDSRIAMNMYKLTAGETGESTSELPKDFTRTAMQTILKLNPFYTEAWYTRFQSEPQDLLHATKMVDEVRAALPDGMGIKKLWKTQKYEPSVGRGDKEGKDILANNTKEYVNVICSVILENALKEDSDYKTFQWTELMAWLKGESKLNTYPEAHAGYQIAYAKAQGTERLKRVIERGFKKAVNFYRDDNNALSTPKDVDQEEMSFCLIALSKVLPKEEVRMWMQTMISTSPAGFKYFMKNKKETKIQPFYDTLTKCAMELAGASERDSIKADMKKASEDVLALSSEKTGDKKKGEDRRRGRR